MHKKRIAKSLIISVAVEAINKISPILVLYVVSVKLGVERFGFAQFSITLIEAAIPFIVFGYLIVGSKDIARLKSQPEKLGVLISSIMSLKFLHALIATVVLVGLCTVVADYRAYLPMVGMLSFILWASAFELSNVLLATQKIYLINVVLGITKLFSLLAIYQLVQSPKDAPLYAVLHLSSNAVVCIASIVIALQNTRLHAPQWSVMKDIFIRASPFALVYLLLNFLDRFDIFFAEYMFGNIGAGLYSSAARISQSLHSLIAASSVIFISELIGIEDRHKFSEHIRFSVLGMSLVLFPICVGIWFVDQDLMSMIFGSAYLNVARLLSVLVLVAGLQSMVTVFGFQILMLKNETRIFSIYLLLSLVLGFGLSLILAPHLGLLGIGLACVMAKSVLVFFVVRRARTHLSISPWYGWFKITFASFAMGLGLYLLKLDSALLRILIGGVIYGLTLSLSSQKEIKMVLHMIKKRHSSQA